jgi:hypothetical protein
VRADSYDEPVRVRAEAVRQMTPGHHDPATDDPIAERVDRAGRHRTRGLADRDDVPGAADRALREAVADAASRVDRSERSPKNPEQGTLTYFRGR